MDRKVVRSVLPKNSEPTDVSAELDAIDNAGDLRSLNEVITKVMARQDTQALIKGDDLERVVHAILSLASKAKSEEMLFAVAILCRLAAVARGRESRVYKRIADLPLLDPPSIETLADADEKLYAARGLSQLTGDWVLEYCIRESLCIDTAEIPRKVLLTSALSRCGKLSVFLLALADRPASVMSIEILNPRLKRVRRVARAIAEVAGQWRGEVGDEPGIALAEFLLSFFKGKLLDVEWVVLFEALDHVLSALTRIIELRFSHALFPDSYAAIEEGKKILGPGMWVRFLEQSAAMPALRTSLLEAALVLARQNRTDKKLVKVMIACYASRRQAGAAVRRHFTGVGDLVPDVAEFWCRVGEVTESRQVEHKVGNSEDEQIGALLLEVDTSRGVMEKLERAVVPLLEISDPVLASTVGRAAKGYGEIAQITRRLARMRKVTPTKLKGERLEYNPLEHELLGGHKTGVRRVKVVRDGIQKDFAGRKRTLVKPWVEPEE